MGADADFRAELQALIPHLRAFAHSLCGNAAAADDLAQDALLRAWRSRSSYKPDTNLRAWTFTILRNCFYSDKRRSWRQQDWNEETANRTLEATTNLDATLEIDDVRRALTALPDDQREALILVGAGGFSYDEAASVCGCAVGTIKSRVNRARKALDVLLDSGAYADATEDDISASDAVEAILDDAKHLARRPATAN